MLPPVPFRFGVRLAAASPAAGGAVYPFSSNLAVSGLISALDGSGAPRGWSCEASNVVAAGAGGRSNFVFDFFLDFWKTPGGEATIEALAGRGGGLN